MQAPVQSHVVVELLHIGELIGVHLDEDPSDEVLEASARGEGVLIVSKLFWRNQVLQLR